MGSTEDNGTWVLDHYSLIKELGVPGGELPSLESPRALWSSASFPNTSPFLSVEFGDSFGDVHTLKKNESKKWARSELCNKARREKMWRDRMNDRHALLPSALSRMVTLLWDEARKLKESNKTMQQKIIDLKVEKNELHDEKQRLKMEKENLERQLKALSTPPTFLAPPPAIVTPFSSPGQVVRNKLVPLLGYPGVSMWQFIPPAVVDTSQDHILRPLFA